MVDQPVTGILLVQTDIHAEMGVGRADTADGAVLNELLHLVLWETHNEIVV